ncbi:MAG TPA: nucleoside diphosphate kinase regulator [Verrucomicrobia bacterium]|nr:nucleoside diphosphate kinase regulator [Verrucomicrobiota bacterium]HOB31847.1 nucleoside diphosphate kinase regulator [Verrucomicrobiota bacterium]HOP97628.1 nucleoside diphosphate kinase regulator [Verrucomicrobiota bacterium]
MNHNIIISDTDARRLRDLLEKAPRNGADELLNRLAGELDRAHIVPQAELPEDVVALGSTVELEDLEDGEVMTYTLTLPGEADASAGRISVLAPLGTGMLGYRVGDEFEWPVPTGTVKMRIRRKLS